MDTGLDIKLKKNLDVFCFVQGSFRETDQRRERSLLVVYIPIYSEDNLNARNNFTSTILKKI